MIIIKKFLITRLYNLHKQSVSSQLTKSINQLNKSNLQQKTFEEAKTNLMKSSNSIRPNQALTKQQQLQQAPLIPNKKLIIHLDVDNVLKIKPSNGQIQGNSTNKDLYIYELCSQWVWGRLERNSKEDAEKVTGWKLVQNTLAKEKPDVENVDPTQILSYKEYLKQYVKPVDEQYEKLLLNISKTGPAAKAKSEIERNIKNITLPKQLYETFKELKQPFQNQAQKKLIGKYASGKYEILPAFFKLIMWLKKSKRQYALIIKNQNISDTHQQIISELNLFFRGEHPLFNGKNGTPMIKFDGTVKGCKNFVIDQNGHHTSILYEIGQENEMQYFMAFGGSLNYEQQKNQEIFRQNFKSQKKVTLQQGSGAIYAFQHSILSQSACIYQINPFKAIFIDQVDYLTHQIYFSNTKNQNPRVESCLGKRILGQGSNKKNAGQSSSVVNVDLFEYLKDVDFFIKKTEEMQKRRADEIERIEKGGEAVFEEKLQEEKKEVGAEGGAEIDEGNNQNEQKDQGDLVSEKKIEQNNQDQSHRSLESNSEYLKRTILPVLEGAIHQVTLLRPTDPIAFIALHCLKNKDHVKPLSSSSQPIAANSSQQQQQQRRQAQQITE